MANIIVKKKRREYKMEDLNKYDVELLLQTANAEPEALFCIGKAGPKLYALGLIDSENRITNDGILAIRSFQ